VALDEGVLIAPALAVLHGVDAFGLGSSPPSGKCRNLLQSGRMIDRSARWLRQSKSFSKSWNRYPMTALSKTWPTSSTCDRPWKRENVTPRPDGWCLTTM